MRSLNGDDRETRPTAAEPTGPDAPRAATPGRERAGFLSRLWARYSSAVRRAVLGRSDWEYLKQFTGGDAYWDNMLAAERRERGTTPAQASVNHRTQQPPTP